MQLYKDEKVNPLGGCWPMLLQMPVLIALFSVFRSTIEFRGAPFFWWIKDLSLPDVIATLPFSIPFYGNGFTILPLVMGVSQLLSMKLTVTDPKQKFQVYFMPVFMTLFFNTLPSGLTLYYTLFNLLTYGQQVWIKKQGTAETAVISG
jgi:YidC/Oxa1 family membrane protein insertase